MSSGAERWVAVLDDGDAHEVPVTRHVDGWWTATAPGRAGRCISTTSPRHAVTSLAARLSWPVVEVLAPGELPRAVLLEGWSAALAEVDRLAARAAEVCDV